MIEFSTCMQSSKEMYYNLTEAQFFTWLESQDMGTPVTNASMDGKPITPPREYRYTIGGLAGIVIRQLRACRQKTTRKKTSAIILPKKYSHMMKTYECILKAKYDCIHTLKTIAKQQDTITAYVLDWADENTAGQMANLSNFTNNLEAKQVPHEISTKHALMAIQEACPSHAFDNEILRIARLKKTEMVAAEIHRFMKTEDRQKIIAAYRRGDIQTNSDMFDLAKSLGCSEKTVSEVVFREMAAGTPCAGCKKIESRFSNSPAWPCSKCTRRDPELKDMFEPE